jgi:hypothetical protein
MCFQQGAKKSGKKLQATRHSLQAASNEPRALSQILQGIKEILDLRRLKTLKRKTSKPAYQPYLCRR